MNGQDDMFQGRGFRCGRLQVSYEDVDGQRRNGTLHPDFNQAQNFPGVSVTWKLK